MTAIDKMVAEFNEKANKAVYGIGSDRFEARLRAYTRDEMEELEERCAKSAHEDDGYTFEFGQLTPEEIYFLLVEHYTYEEANEYLAGFAENERVA